VPKLNLLLLLVAIATAQQAIDPNMIRQKVQKGEALTAEERQFLQQRQASVGQKGKGQNADQVAKRREQYMKENPPRASVGLIPLIDLGPGNYKDHEGGLYAGGKNVPPPQHLKAGEKLAASPTQASSSPRFKNASPPIPASTRISSL
jgi:hypothetical protein